MGEWEGVGAKGGDERNNVIWSRIGCAGVWIEGNGLRICGRCWGRDGILFLFIYRTISA